jgi:hypothetical protein
MGDIMSENSEPIQIYWAIPEVNLDGFSQCLNDVEDLVRVLEDFNGLVWRGGCGTYPLSALDMSCLGQVQIWFLASAYLSEVVSGGNIELYPIGSSFPSYDDFVASIGLKFIDIPDHY